MIKNVHANLAHILHFVHTDYGKVLIIPCKTVFMVF